MPQSMRAVRVWWATNSLYPSRVHMTNGRGRVSLCGFPISAVMHDRPRRLQICPDCAMAYVEVSFPVEGGATSRTAMEWFRALPSAEGPGGIRHSKSDNNPRWT